MPINKTVPVESQPRGSTVYLYHVPVAYPLSDQEDRSRLRDFCRSLIEEIAVTFGADADYFVQTKHLTTAEWRSVGVKNGSHWTIRVGLGLRPTHSLPALLRAPTQVNATLPSEGSQMNVLYRILKDGMFDEFNKGTPWPTGVDGYLGSSGLIVFLTSDRQQFIDGARRLFAAEVDSAFQPMDFFVPVFEMEDFQTTSLETVQSWFQLFDVYIAEITSDPGLFIASCHDLNPILDGLESILQLRS